MTHNNLWQNHKVKITGALIGLLLSGLSILGTYVYTAVNYYQDEERLKATRELIVEEILKPETLRKVLSDSNVVKAQQIREQIIIQKTLENAVHQKKPDSLKLSTKLNVAMDLKRSQTVEKEIAWIYEFCKRLEKRIEEETKQGKPRKIKL